MVFRADGSTLSLIWTAMGCSRSAPPELIIAFTGYFIFGPTALFLVNQIKNNHIMPALLF